MGLIFNNKEIWGSAVPDGQTLYNFGGKSIALTRNYDLGSGSTPYYQLQGVKGDSLTLTASIEDCNNGISVYFEKTDGSYYSREWSSDSYTGLNFPSNPIKIPIEHPQVTMEFTDDNDTKYSLTITVSGKVAHFSINGKGGTLLRDYGDTQIVDAAAIKSIVSY